METPYKSYSAMEMDRGPFCINRWLGEPELCALFNRPLPSSLVPGNFFGLFSTNHPPEQLIERISDESVTFVVAEVLRNERYSVRDEKKRPWASKTRRPFRGAMQRVRPTFREQLELAESVVQQLPPPWEAARRGRKPIYHPIKLAVPLLVKGSLSFDGLAAELRNIGYDATYDGRKASPCPSYLNEVFKKIPQEWLDEALRILDDMNAAHYKRFPGNMDRFVTDGSALQEDELHKIMYQLKKRLVRKYHSYLALIRTATNTFRGIRPSSKRIDCLLPLLEKGCELLADAEFDVEDNYRKAKEAGIVLQVKQAKTEPAQSFRKQARKTFDKKRYRHRKLGERPFGNLEVRRIKCYYRTEESKQKGTTLLACHHNIVAWFKNKAWCGRFLSPG